jgi:hypothetical protein
VPPEELGWRSVTFETVPFAERMQIALDPLWENDIIFIETSSPVFTVSICGVKLAPTEYDTFAPGLSICGFCFFFLNDSIDGSVPFFQDAGKSPFIGIEAEIGIGDNAIVTLTFPSGPYFLGLPLFFFSNEPVPADDKIAGVTGTLAAGTVVADPLGFSVAGKLTGASSTLVGPK